jgi:hypothetical protein
MRWFKNILKSGIALFESPLSAGILAFIVYATFAAQIGPITGTSSFPYFNYLADAFNHGKLFLRLIPPSQYDLALFNGHYSMYWPPFPAILLMPIVALFGVGVSDVLFTLGIGALNVALVAYFFRLLRIHNLVPLEANERGILTIFFAFGTVHLTLTPFGGVWFTSQIVAFFCSILVFVAAIRLKGYPAFFFTGLALACATLTRSHLIFLGIGAAWYLYLSHKTAGCRKLLSGYTVAAIPLLAGVVLQGVYNFLRFGNLFEYGAAYQYFGSFFQADYQKYGLLNLHYFLKDFYYNFIFYPFPLSHYTLMGGSLFLLSPLFFAAFWTLASPALRKQSIALWLCVLTVTIPILLNIGTGWTSFGPRYTLDFIIPLLILTAIGSLSWPKWLKFFLAAISITQYVIGVVLFIKTA